MTGRRPERRVVLLGSAALLCIVSVLAFAHTRGDSKSPSSVQPSIPIYHLDTDHPTYENADEIAAAATTIVFGKVQSTDTEPGESPGVDAFGDPLPAVPRTNYSIEIINSIKGSVTADSTITVTLVGGTNSEGHFVLDGGPELQAGSERLFFLIQGTDNNFYPLAGGAAVATKNSDGTYTLPPDATGSASLTISEGEISNVALPQVRSGELVAGGPNVVGAGAAKGEVRGAKVKSLTLRVRLRSNQDLASALAHGLHLGTWCSSSPCTLAGHLIASARAAKSLKLAQAHHGVTVGSGRAVSGGTLILRFTKEAQRHLRRRARVTLTLVIVGSDAHGDRVTTRGTIGLTRIAATLKA